MIGDPFVIVLCDACGQSEEDAFLTALAGDECFDMRNVRPAMRKLGWFIEDGTDDAVCPDCQEQPNI